MASKRGYVTTTEVDELAAITSTDLQISEAEELIDEYVGFQNKFIERELKGLIANGGANNVTLESIHQNNMQLDYLKGCWIEIIGGTGVGQRKKITGQTYAGVITLESDFSTPLDTTSYYRIWQLGKFPRCEDVNLDGVHTPQRYYKSIPEKLRRATAAQVEFMVAMGDEFFNSDKPQLQSEHIGDYSYSKGNGASNSSSIGALISPKAKTLLRGLINRLGTF